MTDKFLSNDNTLETQFRSIYLLGANTATYKFALAQALLSYQSKTPAFISLDDLTPKFAHYLLNHVKSGKRQISGSGSGKLLNAMILFGNGQITEDQMLTVVRAEGFKYVLDAFHRLPNRAVAIPFFKKELKGRQQGIFITDALAHLFESNDLGSLREEIEGRWNLVESVWSEENEIVIQYDIDTEKLFYLKPVSNKSFMNSHLRTDLTSIRKPLSGYQKGKCFYCYCPISIESNKENTCDVDHVIPMSIQFETAYDLQLNEAWNLVLACKACNRWESGGKGKNMPMFKYIEGLYRRNEYFVESAHPLKENIIRRTGKTPLQRRDFLQKRFDYACEIRKASWEPKEILGTSF